MVMRALMITAVAVTLCACASTAPSEKASFQNAVYMVGDNSALNASASSGPQMGEPVGEFNVVKRVYWFFAGR